MPFILNEVLQAPNRLSSLFLVLVVLCLAIFSNAQEIKWSQAEKSDYRFLKILGSDENGFYVLKSNISLNDYNLTSGLKKREYELSYFSNQMFIQWSKVIANPEKETKVMAIILVNEKPVAVLTHTQPETKSVDLSVASIQEGVLQPAQKLGTYSYEKKAEPDYVCFYSGTTSNQLLCAIANKDKNDIATVTLFSVNERLENPLQRSFQYPSFESMLLRSGSLLANNYFVFLSKDKIVRTDSTGGFKLYSYNISKDSLLEQTIEFEGKYITAGMLTGDVNQGRLIVSGFISERLNRTAAGTFYALFNLSNIQLLKTGNESFPPEFRGRIFGEGNGKGQELHNFYIQKLIPRSDAGTVLVAENFFTSTSTYYDVFLQTYMSRTNYNYNSIIAFSTNPDGTLHWSEVFNKSQVSTEDGGFYSSFCSLTYKDKIYFIYNDFSGSKIRVFLNSISNKGETSSNVLFQGNEDVVLIPKAARQVDENVIIIPGERNGKFGYLQLTF